MPRLPRTAMPLLLLALLALPARSASAQATSATAGATAKAALDDPTIVAIFDAANTWDMESGALGAKRGTTKDVRDFGQMMVRDHRAVRTQGRALAKKLGVHPTPPKNFAMAKDHAAAMRKLRRLHGKAFDKAYITHEVAYHQAVIDAVTNTLMPAIQNQELKDLVTKVAPNFQAHLTAAQAIASRQ